MLNTYGMLIDYNPYAKGNVYCIC